MLKDTEQFGRLLVWCFLIQRVALRTEGGGVGLCAYRREHTKVITSMAITCFPSDILFQEALSLPLSWPASLWPDVVMRLVDASPGGKTKIPTEPQILKKRGRI